MKLKIENMKQTPFTSKDGKNLTRVHILSGGKIYSALLGQWNKNWAVGQEIEVEVGEPRTYNNKTEYPLVAPKSQSAQAADAKIVEILENTRKILEVVSKLTPPVMVPAAFEDVPTPTDEDIPF